MIFLASWNRRAPAPGGPRCFCDGARGLARTLLYLWLVSMGRWVTCLTTGLWNPRSRRHKNTSREEQKSDTQGKRVQSCAAFLTPLFLQGSRGCLCRRRVIKPGRFYRNWCSLPLRACVPESARGCTKHRMTISEPQRCGEGVMNSMDRPKNPQWKLEPTGGKFHWVGRIPSHPVRCFSPWNSL